MHFLPVSQIFLPHLVQAPDQLSPVLFFVLLVRAVVIFVFDLCVRRSGWFHRVGCSRGGCSGCRCGGVLESLSSKSKLSVPLLVHASYYLSSSCCCIVVVFIFVIIVDFAAAVVFVAFVFVLKCCGWDERRRLWR